LQYAQQSAQSLLAQPPPTANSTADAAQRRAPIH